MSHFAVAVISDGTKTVDELMLPYMENCCAEPPIEYMEFEEATDEVADYETGTIEVVRVCLNGHVHLYSKYDNDFKHYQAVTAENHFQPYRYEYPKDSDLVRVPFNVFYPTLEEYMWEYHGIKRDERTGKFGSWQNPNAKWDWYDEDGGRWRRKAYKVFSEGRNSGTKSDIIWDEEVEAAAALKWYEDNVEVEKPDPSVPFIVGNMTKEQYVEANRHLSFRSVVTPDGEWHEVGEMGWWGMSSESDDELVEWNAKFYERFIEPLGEDDTITIVDCHI
jgi:hypothetical protein